MMDFEKAESEEMAAPPVQLRGGREGGREDKGTAPAGLCVNSTTTEERGRGDSSRVIGGWAMGGVGLPQRAVRTSLSMWELPP